GRQRHHGGRGPLARPAVPAPPYGGAVAVTAEFEVPALLRGVRIDRAVSMLTGVTRSVAAGLVAEGKVRVDGTVATTRSLPLEGSVLSVEVPPAADRTP